MSAATYATFRQGILSAIMRRFQAKAPRHAPVNLPITPDNHVEMPLSRMRPGEHGHVLSLCTDCEARQHLLELGFTAGTELKLVRVAPLGDPITVRVRGYQLSLRRREADAVWMRRCPPEMDEAARDAARPGE